MARYGRAAQRSVKRAMHERKHGTLRSGSGGKVKSREQAIAIGLSEAREKGAKVPKKGSSKKRSSKKRSSKKRSSAKSSAHRSSSKRGSSKHRSRRTRSS